jgi:hypothetical protein
VPHIEVPMTSVHKYVFGTTAVYTVSRAPGVLVYALEVDHKCLRRTLTGN